MCMPARDAPCPVAMVHYHQRRRGGGGGAAAVAAAAETLPHVSCQLTGHGMGKPHTHTHARERAHTGYIKLVNVFGDCS